MGSDRIRDEFRPKPKIRRKRPQIEIPLILSAVGGGSMAYTGDDTVYVEGTVGMVTPLTFPNLLRWYKADDFTGIANDGDSIGGGSSPRRPWRDLSGNIIRAGGISTITQNLTTVTVASGPFTFAAGDVNSTIQYTVGGAARDALILAFIDATHVTVDVSQTVAVGSLFGLYDNAYQTAGGGGPQYKANIIGTKPVIRFGDGSPASSMFFNPGAVNDFTIVCVCSMFAVAAGESAFVVSDPFVANHQIRRKLTNIVNSQNTILFFGGAGLEIQTNPAEMITPPLATATMSVGVRRTGNALVFRQNQVNLATQGGVDGNAWRVFELGHATLGTEMDFAEFMMWSRALSDAEISRLYLQYLKPRWTTLP